MAARLGPRFGRALFALVTVLVSVQLMVAEAGAVTFGKNGVLLITAPKGTAFAGADGVPVARVADCYASIPNELWTVHPGGGGLAAVGRGDSGQFSPDGRMLITSFSPGCYSGNALSLSRMPFHGEHAIRGGDFTSVEADAALGPWLGPEDPTFVDPGGTFHDGLTGRPLVVGHSSSGAMSCSGRVAEPNGTIGTPVRASGRVTVHWRRIPGHGWLGNGNVTTVQWSADGRYVYFTTWSRRSDRLWRVDADGAGRRLLFSAPATADLLSDLSPNGRWMLMTTLDGRSGERLSVITTDGLRLHRVTPAPPGGFIDAAAEWSPRGDQLLVDGAVSYFSTTPPYAVTGPSFVYVVRPNGGPRHYLSLPGLGVWSPDERFIAYATSDGTQASRNEFSLVIHPIGIGRARVVLTASVPADVTASNPGGLAVSDWQAAPNSAPPTRCADGQAPF